nr:hypothetical protein [Tanacetum cinerariifolium]
MGKGFFGPNSGRGGKVEVGFDDFRGGGEEIGNYGGNGRSGSSIFGRGRGSLATCLMESKDGLGGGGLVVHKTGFEKPMEPATAVAKKESSSVCLDEPMLEVWLSQL